MDRSGPGGPEDGARRLVRRWPSETTAVALVAPPDAGEAVFEAAAALADASAGERRTLLANLSPERGLDEHLGVPEGKGLLQLGGEGLSLRDIARRPPGRRFVYLPRGPTRDLSPADHPALLRLMARTEARIRERGGRLLLYVREDAGWAGPLADLPGGAVLLGEAAAPDAGGALPVLGRFPAGEGTDGEGLPQGGAGRVAVPDAVPGPGPGPGGDAADGDAPRGGTGGWSRHRRSSGLPTRRVVVGGLVVAVLAAGWWWLARSALPEDRHRTEGAAARETGDAAAGSTEAGSTGGRAAAGEGRAPARELPEVAAAAPELPYSVLIASYAQWEQARGRLRRWREPGGDVYFVAPTRVRGRLYWRLFAGALPDRASAEELMGRLVEEGRKDRVRDWDVRPVGLAFRVAVEGDRDAAASRAEEMSGRGLPAYVLPAATDRDTVWQVYSGGFESPGAAAELERMLDESEIEAELVPRRGESGPE